ncbi:UDP-N-acetylmuramate dehydrogenase [Patescibacteria group bacterium]
MEFEKLLPECKTDYDISKETTMRVGGRVRYFYIAKTQDKLKNVLELARKNSIKYIVIGGGSNIIISDQGFDGLIVKNQTSNIVVGNNEVITDSGVGLAFLVRRLAEEDLSGFEFLTGIPGTIGGAVFGNAGAFGKSMSDAVKSILVLDSDGKVQSISNKDLGFTYRGSNFKKQFSQGDAYNHPVILSINLKVSPSKKQMVLRIMENYMRIRRSKEPKFFSSGSYFRNILATDHPELAKTDLPVIDGKISVGALLERIGAKNMYEGGASVYSGHANWIINKNGRAKAYDIKKLANELKQKARAKFGIVIQEEVVYIGDFNKPKSGFFEKIFKK